MTASNPGLKDAIAIVTGGSKGIGAATARALTDAGARVTVFDVDSDAGEPLAASHENIHYLDVDITDASAVDAAVADVIARDGRIDVLVNNAGIAPAMTLPAVTPEDWQRVLRVNVEGVYNCIRAVAPGMKAQRGGAIVNVSSVAGKNISMGAGFHYTTSKWGLIGMSRHLAYELAPYRIRVNIVCPGPTLTTLLDLDAEAKKAGAASIPLGRWVEAEDVANAILFLVGPGSAMCTGAEIVVDGGALLGSGDAYPAYFGRRGDAAPER